MASVNGKCLTGALRREFKELTDHCTKTLLALEENTFSSLPTGEGVPSKLRGMGEFGREGQGKSSLVGLGKAQEFQGGVIMSILEKTVLVVFNLVINFAHAIMLYVSLNYYLHGAVVLSVSSLVLLLGLVIFQCQQIIKFAERCKLKREE